MKKIILITGCQGRIGRRLVERYKETHQIVGFDIIPEAPSNELDYIKVDLSKDESVNAAFDKVKKKHGTQIASVFHLAAYYNFTGGKKELYDAITVQGTRRLLENLKAFDVEQFVFTSTMLIHKAQPIGIKIHEESPLDASWEYPASKIETEALINEMAKDIPVVHLRIAGCYGDNCLSIPIANHIQRIYEKRFEAHFFPGDARAGAAFVHFDDVDRAFDCAYSKRAKLPKRSAYIIGEAETISFAEMQEIISVELFKKSTWYIRIPKWFAAGGAWMQGLVKDTFIKPWMVKYADANYELNISKAQEELGWKPEKRLRDVFPQMITLLKKSPEQFYDQNNLRG